jgi:hypothetical protein
MCGTTAQIADTAGVAAVGAVFFLLSKLFSPRHRRCSPLWLCLRCRFSSLPHFCRGCGRCRHLNAIEAEAIIRN